MAPPVNNTFATALDLGPLPFGPTVIDVEDGGVNHITWYKYTALDTEWVMFFFAFGDLTLQLPTVDVMLDETTPYLGISAVAKALNISIEAGTTYYFRVTPTAFPNPGEITFEAETAPCTATASPGDLLITNDSPGLPATVLDRNTGAVKGYWVRDDLGNNIPSGEHGDSSSTSGKILLQDSTDPDILYFYNPDGSFNKNISFPVVTGVSPLIVKSIIRTVEWDWAIIWFGSGSEPAHIWITDPVVTVVEEIVLPTLGALSIGVSPDVRYIYVARGGGSSNVIDIWDRTTFGFISPLVASYTAGYIVADIIVLSTGNIAVLYYNASITTAIVELYNPSGTPLFTSNLSNGWFTPIPRAASDSVLTGTTIWVMLHDGNGRSFFKHLRVTDGTELITFDVAEYNAGIYNGSITGSPDKFGVSPSCPIISVPKNPDENEFPEYPELKICPSAAPPAVGSGMYEMIPGKTNETLWNDAVAGTKQTPSKIPDPRFRIGHIGG